MLVDINLLPEKEKERSTIRLAALSIFGVAILISVVLVIVAQSYSKNMEYLNSQLITIQQNQEEIRAPLQLSESTSDKNELESTVKWAENYQFDTVPLLRDLIYLLPKRGFFYSLDFTGPNSTNLTVQFDTSNEAAHYFSRLHTSDFVSNISLDSLWTVAEDDTDEIETSETLPRYFADYTIFFVDGRMAIEKTPDSDGEGMNGITGAGDLND